MGFPFLYFLHNEIQVTVADINAICKLNPLGYILYLSDFRNIELNWPKFKIEK